MTTTSTGPPGPPGPPDRGDNARRPPHHPARNRLTQLATTASRRPWAYLWVPLPLSWQLSVRAMSANSLEEGLAVLLTIPELIGFACVVAMIAWQLWQLGKTIAARFAHRPFRPQVYPWFARIGLWFCVGFVLAGFVAR